MRWLLAIFCVVVACQPKQALCLDIKNSVIFGTFAAAKCEDYNTENDPLRKRIYEEYALGLFSGANIDSVHRKDVGVRSSSSGILGEIRLYCSNHPSDDFTYAVVEMYAKLDVLGK